MKNFRVKIEIKEVCGREFSAQINGYLINGNGTLNQHNVYRCKDSRDHNTMKHFCCI